MSARILIVEDDASLAMRLRREMRKQGYEAETAVDNAEARKTLAQHDFSLVVLDWMLPDGDGLETLRHIRETRQHLPVLFLTARSEVEDRVSGLDAGADDYLTKPFAFSELLARVRTLLRRGQIASERIIEAGMLRVDLVARRVIVGNRLVELTPREYDLLSFLAVHRGEPVSREALTRKVWNAANRYTTLDNVIDVHIANLRKKLREACGLDPLRTIRGVGFMLLDTESENAGSSSV